MTTILIFFAAYFLFHVFVNVAVYPYRKKLFRLIDSALEKDITDHEKGVLRNLAKNAYTIRGAPALCAVYILGILMVPERIIEEANDPGRKDRFSALWEDGTMHTILDYHMASVAAANPLFGGLSYLFRRIFALKMMRHLDRSEKNRQVEMFGLKAAV